MNGNKPDWKNAPAWANYCALDADGVWYWYEERPELDVDLECWRPGFGEFSLVESTKLWKESLEERPE